MPASQAPAARPWDPSRGWRLFLDDDDGRFPPPGDDPASWVHAHSVDEAIAAVRDRGMPVFVSFDNDLGSGREGCHFADWLVEQALDGNLFPPDFDFVVHTQNCVRAPYIEGRLRRYLEHRRTGR